MKLEVHAKPRAKKSRIVGWRGSALEVAIAAPPVDGAANEELVRFLAEVLGIAKRQVVVARGESSRTKLVDVEGLAEADVRARIEAAAATR